MLMFSCATKKVTTPREPAEPTPVETEIETPVDSSTSKFVYNGTRIWTKDLVEVANCVIQKPEVRQALKDIDSFDWTDDNGEVVAAKLLTGPVSELKHYTSNWWAYRARKLSPTKAPVISYTVRDSDNIWFNSRVNPRGMESMVRTVCHEYAHVLGYGHGSNGPHTTGVPNDLAEICGKSLGGCYE